MRYDPEEHRKSWAEGTPSNLDIIGAFAPSEHLELFEVGNVANDTIHVLASSAYYAKIIAMMGGHVRSLRNARLWKPTPSTERGTSVYSAIRGGFPGRISISDGHAIMRHEVYYSTVAAKH